jgi:predicted nucleotidyltransferase
MEQLSISSRSLQALAVFLQTDQPLYVREIARRLNFPPATVSRLLARLARQEILTYQSKGSLKLFQLNPNYPSLPEIKSLVQKSSGLIPLLTQVLKQIPLVNSATIYGSAASNQLTSLSDIDLFIVGQPPLDQLNRSLNRLEKTLGREINYSLYLPEEFRRKKNQPGFLKYVLSQPHQTIIGQV